MSSSAPRRRAPVPDSVCTPIAWNAHDYKNYFFDGTANKRTASRTRFELTAAEPSPSNRPVEATVNFGLPVTGKYS